MLFVFHTCRDFLRTVPALQHDTARAEDLDTAGEDHVADECRYACMSRPYAAAPVVPQKAGEYTAVTGWRIGDFSIRAWAEARARKKRLEEG